MNATWDVKCTWKIYGSVHGPTGVCIGNVTIKAPDPDSALTIVQKYHRMFDISRIEHLSGSPGRLGS